MLYQPGKKYRGDLILDDPRGPEKVDMEFLVLATYYDDVVVLVDEDGLVPDFEVTDELIEKGYGYLVDSEFFNDYDRELADEIDECVAIYYKSDYFEDALETQLGYFIKNIEEVNEK